MELCFERFAQGNGQFRMSAEPLYNGIERVDIGICVIESLMGEADKTADQMPLIPCNELGEDESRCNRIFRLEVFKKANLLQQIFNIRCFPGRLPLQSMKPKR